MGGDSLDREPRLATDGRGSSASTHELQQQSGVEIESELVGGESVATDYRVTGHGVSHRGVAVAR
ncbi:MAG: hypothetical protein ACK4IT_00515 [Thioalkalivibrionaceae bacterium]